MQFHHNNVRKIKQLIIFSLLFIIGTFVAAKVPSTAQPLLTCLSSTPAGFEVNLASAAYCTQPCPTIHIQGLPLEPPCAELA